MAASRPPPSRPRPRDADLSRRAARRSAADRRAGAAPGIAHLRVLTITGFPTATTPGLLDELNRLAFPYRWSTRAILLDKTDATKLLTKIRRQWFAKRKSIAAILKEVMTNERRCWSTPMRRTRRPTPTRASGTGRRLCRHAYVTATVTVWDADPRIADEKLRLVEKVIQGRDFTAMAETINAVDAWLGSCPAMSTPMSGSRRSPRSISPT
jgi:type IV secretion system protein VirB4